MEAEQHHMELTWCSCISTALLLKLALGWLHISAQMSEKRAVPCCCRTDRAHPHVASCLGPNLLNPESSRSWGIASQQI